MIDDFSTIYDLHDDQAHLYSQTSLNKTGGFPCALTALTLEEVGKKRSKQR